MYSIIGPWFQKFLLSWLCRYLLYFCRIKTDVFIEWWNIGQKTVVLDEFYQFLLVMGPKWRYLKKFLIIKWKSLTDLFFYVKKRIYFQKHGYFTNVFYEWNNGDNITEIKYFDHLVVKLANMPSNIRVVLANDGAWWYGPFSGAWCYGPLKGLLLGHINWIQQQAGIC